MPRITWELTIPDHLIEAARGLYDPSSTAQEMADSEYLRGQVELISQVSKRSDNVDDDEVKAIITNLIFKREVTDA